MIERDPDRLLEDAVVSRMGVSITVPDGEEREFFVRACATPQEAWAVLKGKMATWLLGKEGTIYVMVPPEVGYDKPDDGWQAFARLRITRV